MKDISMLLPKKPARLLKILLLAFTLLFSYGLKAQNQTARQTAKSGIWYYEYLPPDYNSNTNNYPIVFFLHGLGERGDTETSLANVARNGPPKHVKNGYKFPFILISPQLRSKYTGWPNSYIDEVIEYCRYNYRVDQSRIYLTGLSLGGGGTWGYAQDPVLNQKLAAIAVMCGHQNNQAKACNIVNSGIPVWAFHGDADTTVPYTKTVNMVKAINNCVPAPNPLALITIYPGVGHNCWDNAYRTDHNLHNPNVYEWLLQYKNGGVKVDAGPDLTLTLPPLPNAQNTSTDITGSASTEVGVINSYTWTMVSGSSTPTITNGSTPTVSLSDLLAGIYTFRLTASNGTETAYDDVKVTVNAAVVNQNPVADAGPDLTITTSSVVVKGTGTDADGTIASYTWAKVSGAAVTMSGQNTANLSLTGLIAGSYVFSLTVKDNLGATATDNVTIVVSPPNQSPTVNAGADITVNLPTSSTNIKAIASDPDGSISSYLWEKVSGPTASMANTTTATVSVSALLEGNYVFQITVKDNAGASATDQVSVTVIAANQSPIANAGADIILTQPTSSTTISGSASDPDGSIVSQAWTKVSGPAPTTLTNDLTMTLTVSDLAPSTFPGVYVFRLTVTDDDGSTSFDDVKVTVNAAPVNIPPVANAGSDQSVTLPVNAITLTGSGTDSDGSITTYNWSKVSGGTATLTDQNTASLTISDLAAGTYIFRLTVTDDQTASSSDDVTLIVQPEPTNATPVASAGTNVVLTLPDNTAILNGTGTDSDGTIAAYEWSKVSGPAVTIANENTSSLSLSDLLEGTYIFQFVVTDDKGATDTDEVSVVVNAANTPPTANAGTDIIITLPIATTDIMGSGSDTDGTITDYAWSQISGPSTATLTNENTSTVNTADLVAGTYVFRLTVTDDDGDSGTDDVKVIVNEAANQAPTAKAGTDKTIILPTTTANFTGTGTDAEGAVTMQWTVSPAATLTNADKSTVTIVVPAVEATYTLTLTVTDGDGATDMDDVLLIVKAPANEPPTANAGANQSITLPVNTITLFGSGTDPEGNIKSYLWKLISGPTATLTNANTATLTASDLTEGIYKFRLTVTDAGDLTATADVTVTVLPQAINQSPVANAGSDQTLTLAAPPDDLPLTTTLFGSGSDTDGSVVAYEWTMTSGTATLPADVTTTNITVSDLTEGVYTFQLTVTDDKGATATDEVTVTINAAAVNQPPVANAGADKKITLPTSTSTLKGTASDPDQDPSVPLIYSWVKVSGPAVTMKNENTANLSLSNLVQGIYFFRLQVEDDKGAIGTDDVKVTVNPATINQSPTANAGPDQNIFLSGSSMTSITLSGSGSDPDGSIAQYAWTQTAGPVVATLTNASATVCSAANLTEGIYTFRLTVKDNKGATSFDEVKITVNPESVNQPPTVNAGSDKNIKLPVNNATLTASGNDPEGGALSYHWVELSGPSSLTFTDANPLALNGMIEGTYEFQVTVTDDKDDTASDKVIVTVLPAAINLPPTADAGGDVSIQLPESTVDLSGSFTDDGSAATVLWTKVSGPDATFSGEDTNNVSISGLTEGTYVFRFTVTDDGSPALSDFDDVTVLVLPADIPNPPPFVFVEGDSILELPDNAATLTAVAGSPNGLIQSYKWEQNFGSPINLENDSTNILEVSNLTLGTFSFRITVKDEGGQEAYDDFIIEVKQGPSNAFSPNDDGRYDKWSIGDPALFTDCEINVYDRQGSKVYHSVSYQQEWDGTFNGKPLPEGVYFYVIRCSNQKPKTGSVTIIR